MSEFEEATGTLFQVQTKFPFGDPVKGMMLRMIIQSTVADVTPGEMMRIILDEKVFVGDHVQLLKDITKYGDPVEFKREPIAIAHYDVAYLKPFYGKLRKPTPEELGARAPALTRHQAEHL